MYVYCIAKVFKGGKRYCLYVIIGFSKNNLKDELLVALFSCKANNLWILIFEDKENLYKQQTFIPRLCQALLRNK